MLIALQHGRVTTLLKAWYCKIFLDIEETVYTDMKETDIKDSFSDKP